MKKLYVYQVIYVLFSFSMYLHASSFSCQLPELAAVKNDNLRGGILKQTIHADSGSTRKKSGKQVSFSSDQIVSFAKHVTQQNKLERKNVLEDCIVESGMTRENLFQYHDDRLEGHRLLTQVVVKYEALQKERDTLEKSYKNTIFILGSALTCATGYIVFNVLKEHNENQCPS